MSLYRHRVLLLSCSGSGDEGALLSVASQHKLNIQCICSSPGLTIESGHWLATTRGLWNGRRLCTHEKATHESVHDTSVAGAQFRSRRHMDVVQNNTTRTYDPLRRTSFDLGWRTSHPWLAAHWLRNAERTPLSWPQCATGGRQLGTAGERVLLPRVRVTLL
ncbi:hypothetical protein K466DRAFT_306446 [Polyporus arcularius HHB13444]|uniref:Uncharacterized protein n=1 Tax=Polyporus arcularius HHB13444 TaxID=1314778 RepID=A0A5C3PPZ3_9APHY|nr:hypothetical protein K466DRAFT_306446 [Polyporus arcularius HHB13444]